MAIWSGAATFPALLHLTSFLSHCPLPPVLPYLSLLSRPQLDYRRFSKGKVPLGRLTPSEIRGTVLG